MLSSSQAHLTLCIHSSARIIQPMDQQQNEPNETSTKNSPAPAKEAPAEFGALNAMAVAYKEYLSYLKDGGRSGISEMFGKLSIGEISRRLNSVSQSLQIVSHGMESEESKHSSATQAEEGDKSASCTVEDKMQAVFEIISGAATLQDISNRHGVGEEETRRWLEVAFQGMEAALRLDTPADSR